MLLSLLALIQDVPLPPPTPDWWLEGANAITLLAPQLVQILVWGALFFVRRIPTWALPLTAVLLGTGYDAIEGLLWENPMLVAVKNVLMFGIREILNTYFTKPLGLAGHITKVQPSVAAAVAAPGSKSYIVRAAA